MKFLKIKLGFFSLLAVFAVSVFLTSCENDPIEKDSNEIVLPELTNNNIDSKPIIDSAKDEGDSNFKNMEFENTEISVLKNNSDTGGKIILLNGNLSVSSVGEIAGKVSTISNDKTVNGDVFFEQGNIIYKVDSKTVELNLNSDINELLVSLGGNKKIDKYDLFEVTDELIEQKAMKKDQLEIKQQAVYAFLAIFNTEAWQSNLKHVNNPNGLNFRGDCSVWEEAAALAAGAAVAALGSVGCGSLSAGCAAGTIATGVAGIPCSVAVPACWAAVGGGTPAATLIVREWLCGDECYAPRNVSYTKTGNNSYTVTWDGSDGDHELAQWANGRWYHVHTTSAESVTLIINGSGTFHIGVSTNCNDGRRTGVQEWTTIIIN